MKIGIVVPSVYMYAGAYKKRISAPMELSLLLADKLVEKGVDTYYFSAPNIPTNATVMSPSDMGLLENELKLDYQQDLPEAAYESVSFYEKKKYFELEVTKLAYEWATNEPESLIHVYHAVGNLAHYFAELLAIPTVYTLHVFPPPEGTIDRWRYQRFAHQQFLPISESQKKGFLAFAPQMNMLRTIYHGVDTDFYTFSKDAKEYLAFMGRLIPQKGLDEALALAVENQKPIQVATQITPVTEKSSYYQEKITPFLDNQLVTIHGLMSGQEKVSFIQKAKALVFPLQWDEPFGMVLIESLAVGTPVIGYAKGSLPEIVKDGETGFLVNPSDDDIRGNFLIKKTGKAGMDEAIKRLYALSSDDYAHMRQNARDHIMNNFTLDHMADAHIELYELVLSRAKKRYFA